MKFEKISVIGLGYIGLPTAAMFALHGVQVNGVDTSEFVVDAVNNGNTHIIEPELSTLVQKVVFEGKLRATKRPEIADAFLITVPTPLNITEKTLPEPDLSFVKAACEAIAEVLKPGNLIVLESTSPVGTTEKMCDWLSKLRDDLNFPSASESKPDVFVAYCPERVLPGKIVHELVFNDRIIGGLTQMCSEAARDLYEIFTKGDCYLTDSRTAEMAKLTENASRDVQIAFANELSILCDKFEIDVWQLIALANKHPRVDILQPGPGVGGHCIAVDPWFIAHNAPKSSNIIQMARKVNDEKPLWVIEKIKKAVTESEKKHSKYSQITIACYGLAFKANIDDLRESPALLITSSLLKLGLGEILIVEPNIKILPVHLQRAKLVQLDEARKKAQIHVLLVDHDEFVNKKPQSGVIVDTKGIWAVNRFSTG